MEFSALKSLDKNSFENLMVRQTQYLKLIAKANIEIANKLTNKGNGDVSYTVGAYTLTELENLRKDMKKHWVSVQMGAESMQDSLVMQWSRRLQNIIDAIESTGTSNE